MTDHDGVARAGHHVEQRPDKDGKQRSALIFELEVESDPAAPKMAMTAPKAVSERSLRLWSRPLKEVRALAIAAPAGQVSVAERRRIVHQRSEAVRVYVLRRADGTCECCEQPAPFVRKNGAPYLEPHHVDRLADGGPDDPAHVAALCPNCHRRIHHGKDGDKLNRTVEQKVTGLEK
jgi:5-methylcytosine-specific restriction protein A